MKYLTVGLLGLSLCACASMQTIPADKATLSELQTGHPLRITPKNGSEFSVRFQELEGDTLTGLRHNKERKVALADIEELRAKKVSASRTLILIGSILTGIGMMAYVMTHPD